MYNKNLHNCVDISIPAPLCFGHLCNWEIRQPEYGLEIPTNLQFLNFHGSENAIKLAKK